MIVLLEVPSGVSGRRPRDSSAARHLFTVDPERSTPHGFGIYCHGDFQLHAFQEQGVWSSLAVADSDVSSTVRVCDNPASRPPTSCAEFLRLHFKTGT